MSQPALEISGLRKGWVRDGRRNEVLDVDHLVVRDGEFAAIVGPSGCGKSTLLHIVGGFLPADAGRIEVDGVPIPVVTAGQTARVPSAWLDRTAA